MPLYSCPAEEDISDFVKGKLDESLIDTIADHIEQCSYCESLAQKHDSKIDLLQAALKASFSNSYLEHEKQFRQAFQSALNHSVSQFKENSDINIPLRFFLGKGMF